MHSFSIRRSALPWLLAAIVSLSLPATAAPRILVAPSASAIEQQAACELQSLLHAATGELCPVESVNIAPGGAPAIVLGTTDTLPSIGEEWPFGLEPPQHDGYILHTTKDGKCLVVAATTAEGVRNGIYGLLDSLGFGFYLSGDAVTEAARRVNLKRLPKRHESRSPQFALRGTVLHHEYLTGGAAWTAADYYDYIDRLVEQRFNCFIVHVDDVERAFGAGGSGTDGATRWGNELLDRERFLAGTGAFIPSEVAGVLGGEASPVPPLAAGLAYARARGLRTGLILPNESDDWLGLPQRQEALLRRILDTCPGIDSLWLWSPELAPQAFPGMALERADPTATNLRQWEDALAYLEPAGRRTVVAREAWAAWLARPALEALRPGVRLVVGGDARFGFNEFIPALNRILPMDVPLAALEDVSAGVASTPLPAEPASSRPRWSVLGLEYDGDLWMPQPALRRLDAEIGAAATAGAEALYGAHWRLSWAEESLGYLARRAWDPELTVERYLERRASDLYGPKLAKDLAPFLLELQDLDYRWLSGVGQNAGVPFSWTPGTEAQRTKLVRIGSEVRELANRSKALPSVLPDVTEPLEFGRDVLAVPFTLGLDLITDPVRAGKKLVGLPINLGLGLAGAVLPLPEDYPTAAEANLQLLYARIRYALALDAAAAALGEGGPFADFADRGDTAEALRVLRDSQLAETMHLLAQHAQRKDDVGILAELNTKAWATIRSRLGAEASRLADLEALPDLYRTAPQMLVLPGSVLIIGADAGASGRAEVLVTARAVGDKTFAEKRLEAGAGPNEFALVFPEETNAAPVIEYGVVAVLYGGQALVWPQGFPAVTRRRIQVGQAAAPENPVPPSGAVQSPNVAQSPDQAFRTVRLTWPIAPGETYRVIPQPGGVPISCPTGTLDVPLPELEPAAYRVEARHLLSGEVAFTDVVVEPARGLAPLAAPRIEVTSRNGWNIVSWDVVPSGLVEYVVAKFGPGQEEEERVTVVPNRGRRMVYAERVPEGTARAYAVAAQPVQGVPGPFSRAVGVIASAARVEPRVSLSLSDESTLLENMAAASAEALTLGGAGWGDSPAQPDWPSDRAVTVQLQVRLDRTDGMPVFVCKGPWEKPAYYLQLFSGRLRFYLAGIGTLDSPPLPGPGSYTFTATYDGQELCLYQGAEVVACKAADGSRPVELSPLALARFGVRGAPDFIEGTMDNIRIYDLALTRQEIADSLDSLSPR